LEELDKKILKTQNSIKELESELTDCMKEAKECRKVIQEIKEMKKDAVNKN
jgi:sugar-specific transcriptional regulator TrmB